MNEVNEERVKFSGATHPVNVNVKRMKMPGKDAQPGNDASAATSAVGQVLNDPERPMKERFRALFTLRNIGGEEAVSQVHYTVTASVMMSQ